MTYFLGLMSGTSMDGIDVALVDETCQHLMASLVVPYEPALAARLQAVMSGAALTAADWAKLDIDVGLAFAAAARRLLAQEGVPKEAVQAIGSHGQTVAHDVMDSPAYTVQLGSPQHIAMETGMMTMAAFRQGNVAAGGQGAPLAPLYHHYLLAGRGGVQAVVNLGGIANITWLDGDKPPLGYDIGPANGLLDTWITFCQELPYDADGAFARLGQCYAPLLASMLSDPFFQQPAPKSIGREYFSLAWIRRHCATVAPCCDADVQATLVALTAVLVRQAVTNHSGGRVPEIWLCGGGVHNGALCAALRDAMPAWMINEVTAAGFSADFLEAMMMAWLAKCRLQGKILSWASLTGAQQVMLLGVIYMPGIDKTFFNRL